MGRVFQFFHARGGRILTSDPSVQGFFLSLHTPFVDGKAGRSLIHPDERDAGLVLQILSHEQRFADGGMRKVGHVRLLARLIDKLFAEYLHFSVSPR